MSGIELLQAYIDSHDLDRSTISWLTLIVGRYARHRGGAIDMEDFCATRVNRWISVMVEEARLSRITIKSYRRGLLILWRWAFLEKHVTYAPLGVKPIKAALPVPRGWNAPTVNLFIRHARNVKGCYRCGIFRADYLDALARTKWDSGLRLGDLMRLKLSDIDVDGRGAIVQKKTGNPITFRLRPSTLKAIAAIRPESRQRIFGGVVSRQKLFHLVRQVCKEAGLQGSLKSIRKGAASAVERDYPGQAGKFLGHKTPGLAEKHYIDPSIVQRESPTPPPLDDGDDRQAPPPKDAA